ncbi:hypothetical protein DL96DRAFT_1619788 [Flagelloscypha sp. PMI_526]|nr:hypothetical protein DL96DRAFT_1619788 [Flagelloscypha sp. PMI_526]
MSSQEPATSTPPPETQPDLETGSRAQTENISSEESESEEEEDVIKLAQIPSLAKLYEDGILKEASKVYHKPNKGLLERVAFVQADITKLQVDSIVNAANRSLLGGGGVDGAIHRAAGPNLVKECRLLDGCDTGQSKITRAYNLPSSRIIHTVGPVYSESQVEAKAALLRSCYQTSLELAVEHGLRHIAFCSVSTGIYGYPIKDATRIALDTVRKYLEDESSEARKVLERVIFVVFPERDKQVYLQLIPEFFPDETPSEAEDTVAESTEEKAGTVEPEVVKESA